MDLYISSLFFFYGYQIYSKVPWTSTDFIQPKKEKGEGGGRRRRRKKMS